MDTKSSRHSLRTTEQFHREKCGLNQPKWGLDYQWNLMKLRKDLTTMGNQLRKKMVWTFVLMEFQALELVPLPGIWMVYNPSVSQLMAIFIDKTQTSKIWRELGAKRGLCRVGENPFLDNTIFLHWADLSKCLARWRLSALTIVLKPSQASLAKWWLQNIALGFMKVFSVYIFSLEGH